MDIKLILRNPEGKRYTLPVEGVDEIIWREGSDEEEGIVKRGAGDRTILTIDSAPVVTIYREDKRPAKAGRRKQRRRDAPEPLTPSSDEPEPEPEP